MWEYISGSLAKPVQTLRSAAENNLWKQGLVIVIVLSMLKGSTATVAMRNEEFLSLLETPMSFQGIEFISFMQSPLVIITFALVGGIVQWLLAGVLFHLFAKLFKGQGTLSGVLASTGYAQSPYFIGIPLTALLSLSAGTGAAVLSGIISFGIGVWVLVLGIIAIKETYQIGTGAAAAAFFIPFILLFVVALFLIGILTAVILFMAAP